LRSVGAAIAQGGSLAATGVQAVAAAAPPFLTHGALGAAGPLAAVQGAATLMQNPAVAQAVQAGVGVTNEVLKGFTIPLRIVGPHEIEKHEVWTGMDASESVWGRSDTTDIATEDFIDALRQSGTLKPLSDVPWHYQRMLYADMARVVVVSVERSLAELGGSVGAFRVTRLHSSDLKPAVHSTINSKHVEQIVTELVRRDRQLDGDEGPYAGAKYEVYRNVGMIIVQVLEASLESVHVEVAGHSLRLSLEPKPNFDVSMAHFSEDLPPTVSPTPVIASDALYRMMQEANATDRERLERLLDDSGRVMRELLSTTRVAACGNAFGLSFSEEDHHWEQQPQVEGHASAPTVQAEREAAVLGSDESTNIFAVKEEFAARAAANTLGRCLHQRHHVEGNLDAAFSAVSDFRSYSQWMPWCDHGEVLGGAESDTFNCIVGFGIDAPMLGRIGDQVQYTVHVVRPKQGAKYARCVATSDGFAYGDALIYDWKFKDSQQYPGSHVDVVLDVYFQAKSWAYLPMWDALENRVIADMVTAFKKRIKQLSITARPA